MNNISFKFSLKKIYNGNVILFILINILILCFSYKFYTEKIYTKNNQELRNELNSQIPYLKKNIFDSTKLADYFNTKYVNNNYFISISDDTRVIYSNYEQDSYYNSYNLILNVNNTNYYISLAKSSPLSFISLMIYMILIEVFIIISYVIVTTMIVNKNLLTPVDNLILDIKRYKYGIKPSKRNIHSRIDVIQNEFVDLVDTLEKSKDEQNRIIASISHDIKTPLTSLLGYTSRLETASLDETKKNEYIKKIYNKSLDMKDLITYFDDYISVNLKDNVKENLLVKDLLDKIYDDYYIDLQDKNIKFTVRTRCKNEIVNLDINKMKRVFSNIITNSVRYLNKDVNIIDISTKKVKNDILITVLDNGIGVSNESLDKIFEPLYTSDPSRKISGLGLSICKEIVEAHSGNIRAYNNKKGGLSIEIRLPLTDIRS